MFKEGDVVRINEYGDNILGHYSNPRNCNGVVDSVRPSGKACVVRWENGEENSYSFEWLELSNLFKLEDYI